VANLSEKPKAKWNYLFCFGLDKVQLKYPMMDVRLPAFQFH
jgi:hypothetical protein